MYNNYQHSSDYQITKQSLRDIAQEIIKLVDQNDEYESEMQDYKKLQKQYEKLQNRYDRLYDNYYSLLNKEE